MTENISSDIQPTKCVLTPDETAELLRVKLSWLYPQSRSYSACIRYLDRGAMQPKSLEELVRFD